MTYNVFGGTLNLAQLSADLIWTSQDGKQAGIALHDYAV